MNLTLSPGDWEIYPAKMFQMPAGSFPNQSTYCRIAAVEQFVFVGLYEVGIAVWRHNPSDDTYTCVGLLRPPVWTLPGQNTGATLRVRDLHAWVDSGRVYLSAAVADARVETPSDRTPRAVIWELSPNALQLGIQLEPFDPYVGVPIAGGTGTVLAPGRVSVVIHRAGNTARLASFGVNVSYEAGEPILWVTGADTLDSFSLQGLGMPQGMGSVANRSGFPEQRQLLPPDRGTVRLISDPEWKGGIAQSAGGSKGCGAPNTAPVSSDYCNTRRQIQSKPSAVGSLAMAGTFRSVAAEAWLARVDPTGAEGLVKVGVAQRFPAARGSMSELFAEFFGGNEVAPTGASDYFFFGSIKAHLGRVDLRVPGPNPAGLQQLVSQVRGAALSPALQPGGPACTPTASTCASLPASAVPTSRYTAPGGQVTVREACLPATPVTSVSGLVADQQYPANGCAVFADEGFPPLVGWGYGGEWLDGAVSQNPLRPEHWVVFLADKASGAVHAHRSMLDDGGAVDVFPGYDPRNQSPAYMAQIWPDATDSLADYFPARNRIPSCSSVAVIPWPHPTAVRSDTSLVVAVGTNDPDLSIYLAPWRWSVSDGRTGGEFLYRQNPRAAFATWFEVRRPLDGGGAWSTANGDVGGVRSLTWFGGQPKLLAFFQPRSNADALVMPDLALVGAAAISHPVRPELVLGSSMPLVPIRLPRDPSTGDLLIPGGPSAITLLDARDGHDRVYLLGKDESTALFWLLTLEKQPLGAPSPLVVLNSLQLRLEAAEDATEPPRLSISPDGRWLATTFGSATAGVLLIQVPEQSPGVLGAPVVVEGLRFASAPYNWEGWNAAMQVWQPLTEAYTRTQRGADGVTRAPVWPLLPLAVLDAGLEPLEIRLGYTGHTAEFFESNGVLLLAIDTDPLTLWKIGDPSTSAPNWEFVGAAPTDGSKRQRVAWSTPEGLFFLGDTGAWAVPRCSLLFRHADERCPIREGHG